MKKIAALILAASMMALTACSQPVATDATADAATTKDYWQSKKSVVIGLDDAFPPMGYVDPDTNQLIGFDIDLANATFEKLGFEVKIQPIDWDNKELELNGNNVDLLWNGYSYTEERAQKVNLSEPYMRNNQILLVKAGSSYKTLADLAGKSVGVQADSSAEDALDAAADFKASLKEVIPVGDYAKAVLEIQKGSIDAIAIDEVVARYYLANDPQSYRILQNDDKTVISLAEEDYVIGFRKTDDALKILVQDTLKEMVKDGTAAEISQKWFGEDVLTIGK